MRIIGEALLKDLAEQRSVRAKMVLNENGAIIFPASEEHQSQKAPGISYEDNYRGNAVAVMLSPGKIEIRYHAAFTDERVLKLVVHLLAHDVFRDWPADYELTYQGRLLRPVDD